MNPKDLILSSLSRDRFGEDFAIRWAIDESQRRRDDVTRFLEASFGTAAPSSSSNQAPSRTIATAESSSRTAKRAREEDNIGEEVVSRAGPPSSSLVSSSSSSSHTTIGGGGGAPAGSSFAALIRAARAKQQQQASSSATVVGVLSAAGETGSNSTPSSSSSSAELTAQKEAVVSTSGETPLQEAKKPNAVTVQRTDEDDEESFDVHPLQFAAAQSNLEILTSTLLHSSSSSALSHQRSHLQQEGSGGTLQRGGGGEEGLLTTDEAGNPIISGAILPGGAVKHPSQMTKEEYMKQFRRAPRRGEIGISADRIAEAESLGYIMSGSRKKEAVRYIDRVQRQLHEREAAKMRLQFLQEEDRRNDSEALAEIGRAHV